MNLFAITNPVLPAVTGAGTGEIALGNIISAVLGLFLLVGTIAALIYIMLGALSWITAAGDKTKLEKAQSQITQAIVGIILLASVWAIMLLVGQFTGIGFPTFTIPTVENAGSQSQQNQTTCGWDSTDGVCCTSVGETGSLEPACRP